MKFILAKKLEMSQVFRPDGTVVPVTLVQAGPCIVTQVKTKESDGYTAIQVGFLLAKKLSRAETGHQKDLSQISDVLREFRLDDVSPFTRGDMIQAATFAPGDAIEVTGTSKGKGFQGVVRRHHFGGHPASHGHKDQARMPGSSGAGGVQHVLKGTRKPGQMGHATVTIKNLEVVEVRDNGVIAVKGAVPGARHAILEVRTV